MKRNPQGQVDKRIRATLRPMSKNRRDSSSCELEQRLRDVKTNNCRFRKALMEKEAELQVQEEENCVKLVKNNFLYHHHH